MKLRNIVRTQENLSDKLHDFIPSSREAKLDKFTVSVDKSNGIMTVYQTYKISDGRDRKVDLELDINNEILAYKFRDGNYNLNFKFESILSLPITMGNHENEWYYDEKLGLHTCTIEYNDGDYDKFYHFHSLVDYRQYLGNDLIKIELLNDGKVYKLKFYAKEPITRGLLYFYVARFGIAAN